MTQFSPSVPPPQGAAIEIVDVLRGMWRRRLLVVLLMLTGFVLSFAFVMLAKPQYFSEAQVLVDRLETPYDRTQPTDPADRQPLDDRDILSQVSVLNSQDLGERVITALKLTERQEFDPLKDGLSFTKRLAI